MQSMHGEGQAGLAAQLLAPASAPPAPPMNATEEGSPPFQATVVAATAAPAAPQTSSAPLIQVAVPTGAEAGQRIAFRTPDGQPMFIITQEALPPHAVVSVRCPQPAASNTAPRPAPAAQLQQQQELAPRPPPSAASVAQAADRAAATMGWWIYAAGWLCCCCVFPPCAFICWTAQALAFFCRPAADRAQRPLQRGPSYAAAATVCASLCCGLVAALIGGVFLAVCGPDEGHCKGWQDPFGQHTHWPLAPMGGRVNLTVTNVGCGSEQSHHRFLYEGHSRNGRAYYRDEHKADSYLYFTRGCNPKDPSLGAWVVAPKTKHELPEGCRSDALMFSNDAAVPIGDLNWDFLMCGDHAVAGAKVSIRADPPALAMNAPPWARFEAGNAKVSSDASTGFAHNMMQAGPRPIEHGWVDMPAVVHF